MSTIPASLFAAVTPSVLGVGGSGVVLNGVVLTKNTRVPIGTVMAFPSALAVEDFFGPDSLEATIAGGGESAEGISLGSGYFGGFDNATQLPGSLLFFQYNSVAVAAYLRGGDISLLPLATLQGYSGTLAVVVDGYARSGTINLSAATSFSNAATSIATALNTSLPVGASITGAFGASFTASAGSPTTKLVVTAVTGYLSPGDVVSGTGITAGTTITSQDSGGTPGGAGTYNLSAANTASAASCTSTSAFVDVSAVASGALAIGQTVTGVSVPPGTIIIALGTGTGGVGLGTYLTNLSVADQISVASESMTTTGTPVAVTFDSQSGAFVITSGITGAPSSVAFPTASSIATDLLLTSATGGVLSQGAAPTTPAAAMNAIYQQTQNWACYMTAFDPDGGSGNTLKQAFAAWKNNYPNRFCYAAWDTDVTPTESVPAESSLGYILQNNDDSGTALVWEPSDFNYAAFIMGYAASLNFNQTNGRTTLAARSQAGLTASVTTETAAVNLGGNPQVSGSFGNGYNYYGAIATANQNYVNMQRGTVTGKYQWLDSYLNQIWLTSIFQNALMTLLQSVGSIPYNAQGNATIAAALNAPIQAGLNFGAYRAGVTLSPSQIAAVNTASGINIAPILQTQGWYLQIGTASATVRNSRGSPPMTFWYVDGQSVQSFSLNSVEVQ